MIASLITYNKPYTSPRTNLTVQIKQTRSVRIVTWVVKGKGLPTNLQTAIADGPGHFLSERTRGGESHC